MRNVSRFQRQESVQSVPFPVWPHFDEDEIKAVEAVLRSGRVNYWTGTHVRAFEQEYARHAGSPHAIALANGTVSLELALVTLGIGPGDEVVTTPRTFIASASCSVMRGATPVFADVDRNSQNITADSIERVLSPKTKAIIPVHLAGWPCEMDAICGLAAARGIAVIEDCAQANGASYKGKPIGTFGEFGSFSFCQDKIITTGGEGGLLLLKDESHWSKAWAFKDHGKSYEAVHHRQHAPGFRWLHESFGTNWRMTEMQAALGRIQLSKLPQWVAQRRLHAQRLREGLSQLDGVRVPEPEPDIQHAYYKFYAFLDIAKLRAGWSRDRVIAEIAQLGVPCFSGSCSEVYLEAAFESHRSRPAARLEIARELGETSLMFLTHPTLRREHIDRAVEVAQQVIRAAVR